MNKKSMVDIICPCYNDSRFISQLIDCLIAQTYNYINIIMVDDGSTDNSYDLMLQKEEIVRRRGFGYTVLTQQNGGPAAAYNLGLTQVKNEYVLQIDMDDTILPDAVEKMAMYLDCHPNVAVVRTNGWMHYINLDKPDIEFLDLPNLCLEDQLKPNQCENILMGKTYLAPPCSYMYRTELFFHCYPKRKIDETRLGQNYQVLLPLTFHYDAGYINKGLFYYTIRNDSLEHSKRTVVEELNNIDESARLIHDILVQQGADEEYASKWAIYRKCVKKIPYAYQLKDKNMSREYYAELKKLGMLNRALVLDYLSTCYFPWYIARQIVKFLIHLRKRP